MSRLPEPVDLWQRTQYTAWAVFYYMFTFWRNLLLSLRVISHIGRQDYFIGQFREGPGRDMKNFLAHLAAQGFGNHFIAWIDDGEIIGVRRMEGFERQYHLRIFKDGEIRGHYEFSPEAHPIMHLHQTGMEPRREEFLEFLGDWVTPMDAPLEKGKS